MEDIVYAYVSEIALTVPPLLCLHFGIKMGAKKAGWSHSGAKNHHLALPRPLFCASFPEARFGPLFWNLSAERQMGSRLDESSVFTCSAYPQNDSEMSPFWHHFLALWPLTGHSEPRWSLRSHP